MKKLFYILFCFSLLGCSDPKPQKPANLVRQGKMVQILADIHTIESQIEQSILYPDTALMTFNHHQQEVIEKHGVTEENFRKTYRYYLQNLTEMDKLYETVIDTLSIREIKAANKAREEIAVIEEEALQPPVVADTVAGSAADPVTVADSVAVTATATPKEASLKDVWICKLLYYQRHSFTVSVTTGMLPFYLSPAIHDLPQDCLSYKMNTDE